MDILFPFSHCGCGIRSLSWLYFRKLKSSSLARPPLASAHRSPDARFESHILAFAQTKTTLFGLFLVLAGRLGGS